MHDLGSIRICPREQELGSLEKKKYVYKEPHSPSAEV